VQHYLQQEAVQTTPWPAMSPDMNPIEHVWDFIGRKINQRNPKCQNMDELRTAILQEWQQFPQEKVQVQLNSQRKNNPRQLHPTPKSSCAQNVVVLK
jgi:hypothetical protein